MPESYTKPPKKSSGITLVAEHPSDYAAITRPSKLVYCSEYFVRRWMPLLGGTGTQIVLALRRHGYHDRDEGKHREHVDLSVAQVAAEVGCSVRTLQREFSENQYLSLFVQREKRYYRHPTTNHILREENRYHVHMEDPVHIDDQKAFDAAQLEKDKNAGPNRKPQNASDGPARQNDTYAYSRNGQNGANERQPDMTARQPDASARQKDAPTRQIGMALKDTFDTEDKKNTSTTSSEAQHSVDGENTENTDGLAPEAPAVPARAVVEISFAELTITEQSRWFEEALKDEKVQTTKANCDTAVWDRTWKKATRPIAERIYKDSLKGGA